MSNEWDQDEVKRIIEKIKNEKPLRLCKVCMFYNGEDEDCYYGKEKCDEKFSKRIKKWKNKLKHWENKLDEEM